MRIATNGIELEVEVQGEMGRGTPVLLLHGWPDDHHLWDAQVAALNHAGYCTIAPDLRGLGKSSRPDRVDDYALHALLADAVGVLDELQVDRAHVVGHDWGAAVAWLLAAVLPHRVDHLVAMSVGHPAAFAGAGIEQRERSWYMLLFQFVDVAEQWLSMDDWANLRAWGRHPDLDPVIGRLARPGALTASLNLYRANLPPERLVTPTPALPPVEVPTMGVWSSDDRHLTEAQMTESAAHVKALWRYERLDGVGHWMQIEAPDALNALLLDFLPSPPSSPSPE
jgi:pimeloyl-ACP methyl ester carboxylesterase